MQDLIDVVRDLGGPLQILTLFMLSWSTFGHRVWAHQREQQDSSAPRYVHITWRLNAALVVAFVGFMVYAAIFGGRNLAVICVMAAAVILSCLHTAILSYTRNNMTYAGFMVGAALSFFGYGGMLIGGPLWVQTMAAVLMCMGLIVWAGSILAPEPHKQAARAA